MDQEKIGSFISKLRKEKNMTQVELAEKIGVTDKAISKWENGRGLPDISCLTLLSKEFGISLNELISGERLNKKEYQEVFEQNIYKSIESQNKFINKIKKILKVIFIIVSINVIFLTEECIRLYYEFGRPLIVFSNDIYIEAGEFLYHVYDGGYTSYLFSIKYSEVQSEDAGDLFYVNKYGFYLFHNIKIWEHIDKDIPIYELVNVLDKVSMKIVNIDDNITIRIKDESAKDYIYNDWYKIEIDTGGFGWTEYFKNNNYYNSSKKEYKINNGYINMTINYKEKYKELKKGKYRLIKYLYDKKTNTNKYFFVDFEIE